MRDDSDFTSYVVARWTAVVRTLVLLGAPEGRAHRVAHDAFARAHEEWGEHEHWADPDVRVYRMVLDRLAADRGAWWLEPDDPDRLDDLAVAGWRDLEPELDGLTQAERSNLVLREVAGLSDAQVAEVLGGRGGRSRRDPRVLAVADRVRVDPPPVDQVLTRSVALRRRRRRLAVVGTAAVAAALVAGVALANLSSDPPPAPQGDVTALEPVETTDIGATGVSWYADGVLSLSRSAMDIDDVRAFDDVDDGAVYLDADGALVHVTADGDRTRLAVLGPDATFAVSDTDDAVAWIDPDAAGGALVLQDIDGERDQSPVEGDDPRVIAIDSGRVYYAAGGVTFTYEAMDGTVTPGDTRELLDVVAGARAYQLDPTTIAVRQDSIMSSEQAYAGVGAELDSGGGFVLTRAIGGEMDDVDGGLRVYGSSTGREVDLGLSRSEVVLGARFASGGRIAVVVADEAAREQQLRVCSLFRTTCRLLALFPIDLPTPLLAGQPAAD